MNALCGGSINKGFNNNLLPLLGTLIMWNEFSSHATSILTRKISVNDNFSLFSL